MMVAVVAYMVPAVTPQEPVLRTQSDPWTDSVETGVVVPTPTLPALLIVIPPCELSSTMESPFVV